MHYGFTLGSVCQLARHVFTMRVKVPMRTCIHGIECSLLLIFSELGS